METSQGAPQSPDEATRLHILQSLKLLDTPPEQAYDDIVKLLASICQVPTAAISLIDADRQWFKARVGLDLAETPRMDAFCVHTIQAPDLLVVQDATSDPRFATNPLVLWQPHIRFYAGVPLRPLGDETVGSLCAIDYQPRQLTDLQLESLQALGRQVSAFMRARRQLFDLHEVSRRLLVSEKALSRDTVILRSILNSMAEGVLVADRDGQVLFCNQIFARTHGYAVEGVPLDHWSEAYGYYTPDGQAYFPADRLPLARALHREAVDSEMILLRRPYENDYFMSVTARPLLINDQVEGAVVVSRDVTREWDLQRTKDQMLAIASHEIRSPLTSIIGALGLVNHGMVDAARQQVMVSTALHNAERMHTLLCNLLDLEKLREGGHLAMTPCKASDLASELLEVMGGMAESSSIRLDVQVPMGFTFMGDREKLARSLTNLVSNALKFSGEGTTVRIVVARQEGQVRFEVTDEGPGIPAERMAHLFERFQSWQNGSPLRGSGLGLALAREIARQHGGDITAENQQPRGAQFVFTFPFRAG